MSISDMKQNIAKNFMRFCEYYKIDLIKLVLTFTWYWAYIGVKLAKLFEFFFMVILYLPDYLYLLDANIKNSRDEKIKIIYARTDYGEITNKMKFFLRWYWENINEESIHETNGFDITELTKLFNCSMLYCSYLLIKKDEKLTPELFLTNIKSILITQNYDTQNYNNQSYNKHIEENKTKYTYKINDKNEIEQVLSHLNDKNKLIEQNISTTEESNLLDDKKEKKPKKEKRNKKSYAIKQIINNFTTIKELCFDHVDFM